MATHHPSLLIVWIWFTAALVGCRSSQEMGDVRGMVTIGDEPLDSVMVYFMPDPGEQAVEAASWGVTDAEGRYHLEYQGAAGGFGAVAGKYRVTLEDLASENARGEGPPPAPRIPKSMMNPQTTTLRFDVVPGEQTIDIDLKATAGIR